MAQPQPGVDAFASHNSEQKPFAISCFAPCHPLGPAPRLVSVRTFLTPKLANRHGLNLIPACLSALAGVLARLFPSHLGLVS